MELERLIRRYAGDAFAETRLDDGLHAIVDKNASSEEEKLSKQQRIMGVTAHLSLQEVVANTQLDESTEFLI